MNQNTFQPEDFSPIHLYPEVPDKKGWYVSTWGKLEKLHKGTSDIYYSKNGLDFWYWNEKEWCADDSNACNAKASCQDRDWFGLNHEPKS